MNSMNFMPDLPPFDVMDRIAKEHEKLNNRETGSSIASELKSLKKQNKFLVYNALANFTPAELIKAVGQEFSKTITNYSAKRTKITETLINMISWLGKSLGECSSYHEAKKLKLSMRESYREICTTNKLLAFKVVTDACNYEYSNADIQKIFKCTIESPHITLKNAYEQVKNIPANYSAQQTNRAVRDFLNLYMQKDNREFLFSCHDLDQKNCPEELNWDCVIQAFTDTFMCGNFITFKNVWETLSSLELLKYKPSFCNISNEMFKKLSKFSHIIESNAQDSFDNPFTEITDELWKKILIDISRHVFSSIRKSEQKLIKLVDNLCDAFVKCHLRHYDGSFYIKTKQLIENPTPYAERLFEQQFKNAKMVSYISISNVAKVSKYCVDISENLRKYHFIYADGKNEKIKMLYPELKSAIYTDFCKVMSFSSDSESSRYPLNNKDTLDFLSHCKNKFNIQPAKSNHLNLSLESFAEQFIALKKQMDQNNSKI